MIYNFAGLLRSTWLIVQFELYRVFMSVRGWLFLSTFALVWCFVLNYFILNNSVLNLSVWIVQDTGWPVPELTSYWRISLYIFPLLCLLITADQTCSDRVRGTLRFLVLRTDRDSIFFGRFISQMLIQMVLVVATALTVFIAALIEDSTILWAGAVSTAVIISNIFLALLPFTAMMAMLSVIVKSTRNAVVLAIFIWISASAIIKGVSHYLPFFEVFDLILPGRQLSALSGLPQADTFSLAYVPILQCLVFLMVGRLLMLRASL